MDNSVINPLTNRMISKTGKLYKRLVKHGIITPNSDLATEQAQKKEAAAEEQSPQATNPNAQNEKKQNDLCAKDLDIEIQNESKECEDSKKEDTDLGSDNSGNESEEDCEADDEKEEDDISMSKLEKLMENQIQPENKKKIADCIAKAAEKIIGSKQEKLKELKDENEFYDELRKLLEEELENILSD